MRPDFTLVSATREFDSRISRYATLEYLDANLPIRIPQELPSGLLYFDRADSHVAAAHTLLWEQDSGLRASQLDFQNLVFTLRSLHANRSVRVFLFGALNGRRDFDRLAACEVCEHYFRFIQHHVVLSRFQLFLADLGRLGQGHVILRISVRHQGKQPQKGGE